MRKDLDETKYFRPTQSRVVRKTIQRVEHGKVPGVGRVSGGRRGGAPLLCA